MSTRTNPTIPANRRPKTTAVVMTIVRLCSIDAKFKYAAVFQVSAKLVVTMECIAENCRRPLVEEDEDEVDELDADKRRLPPQPHKHVVLVPVAAIGMQSGLGTNARPSHKMHCGVKADIGHWYPISPTTVPLQPKFNVVFLVHGTDTV